MRHFAQWAYVRYLAHEKDATRVNVSLQAPRAPTGGYSTSAPAASWRARSRQRRGSARTTPSAASACAPSPRSQPARMGRPTDPNRAPLWGQSPVCCPVNGGYNVSRKRIIAEVALSGSICNQLARALARRRMNCREANTSFNTAIISPLFVGWIRRLEYINESRQVRSFCTSTMSHK